MDKQPRRNDVMITEAIITSFLWGVYPLKNPSTASHSNLDNGLCSWNFNRSIQSM